MPIKNQQPIEQTQLQELLKTWIQPIINRLDALEKSMSHVPASVETDILDLRDQLGKTQDFTLQNRLLSTLSSQSLPLINMQFKRVLVDVFSTRQSLQDVEEQLADEYSSVEELMRERSRLSEKNAVSNNFVERALRNYRAVAEENIALSGKTHRLEQELKASKELNKQAQEVLKVIQQMSTDKAMPADVITHLKDLWNEIPKPLPRSHSDLPVPGEAELSVDDGGTFT